ncbi:MAG: biopolymer transporter ExbD [Akkermansia sp.]|nr:biopolymer transporter ExbD [Akkermansia sp.]MDO4751437.1 biopolymer transporter ExbD [Akkermansia sp.]
MKIYTRKPILQGINIVPMLDILTILLIFFIVQTEFKRQVSVLHLDIPETRHLAGSTGDRNQILLEVGADGELALGGKILTAEEMPEAVQQLLRDNPEATIQVSAAQGAELGRFIQVLDTLNEAGLSMDDVPIRINPQP